MNNHTPTLLDGISEHDAAELIRRSRLHDELVAALTDVLDRWTKNSTDADPFPSSQSNWDAILRARAALAKVKP